MPRSGSTISASSTVECYSCGQRFSRTQLQASGEEGNACCPSCGSDFVELLDQAPISRSAGGDGGVAQQPPAATDRQPQDGAAASSGLGAAAGEPRGGGNSLGGARIEFTAMFHPAAADGGDTPLTFVEAISRFAPLSLPNGQQAFVLQVQDGALLSPFTMGIPFGDALALNPGDWVVGDDLDAVVTRVLDAYMPPRRATAPEVRDALPRLRVRPGPLSPRPTAALEAAARAASAASFSLRPATATTAGGSGGGGGSAAEDTGDGGGGGTAAGVPEPAVAAAAAAAAADGPEPTAAFCGAAFQVAEAPAAPGHPPVAVRVRLEPLAAGDQAAAGDDARGGGDEDSDGVVRLRLRYCDAGHAATAASAPVFAADAARAAEATITTTATTTKDTTLADAAPASVGTGASDGYASCQPGELCTVCHDAFEAGSEVVQLPCAHCFHEDCILPWLQQQNTCPVCRTRLRETHGVSGGSSHRQQPEQPQQQPQQQAAAAAEAASTGDGGAASDQAGAAVSGGARPSLQPPRPRAGAGGRAGPHPPHFPLLGALRQQLVAPAILSPEERAEAEASLAGLRTRFTPLQLTLASTASGAGAGAGVTGPAATASLPLFGGGAGLLPALLGARGGALTHGTRASTIQGRSAAGAGAGAAGGAQGPGQAQGAATALRGGFFNNPFLNLYGRPSGDTGASAAAQASGGIGGAAAASGTRSALRGGFFNSGGGGGVAAGEQPHRSGGGSSGSGCGASGLGAAGALPRRQQRQPQAPRGNSTVGGGAAAMAAAGSSPPPALRPETLPRMIWSVAVANAAQAGGLLATNPYALPIELALGRGGPTRAAGPAPAGARSGGEAASSPPLPPLVTVNNMALALANPDLGAETVMLQLARLLGRLDRAGRPRPTEASLRDLHRLAMMAAAQMVQTMPPTSPPDGGIMARVAAEGDRWVARATELLRRPPRSAAAVGAGAAGAAPQANAAATSGAAGTHGGAASSQRDRPSGGAEESVKGGEEAESSADEGPTRRVARHTQAQDAASLAHHHPHQHQQQQQQQGACSSSGQGGSEVAGEGASRPVAAAVLANAAEGGSAAAAAAGPGPGAAGGGSSSGASGRGARGRPVVRARVAATARGGNGQNQVSSVRGAATAPAAPSSTAGAAAAATRRRSGSSMPRTAGLGDSGSVAAAAAAPPAKNGGGGGGFNPLAAVVGGAGAGLRFLGGVAGGLFRRGRGNGNGNGSSGNGDGGGSGALGAGDGAVPGNAAGR